MADVYVALEGEEKYSLRVNVSQCEFSIYDEATENYAQIVGNEFSSPEALRAFAVGILASLDALHPRKSDDPR